VVAGQRTLAGVFTRRPAVLLAAIAASLGAFTVFVLVRPLFGAGGYYGPSKVSSPYGYNWAVVALFVPYLGALWFWSRGRAPSLGTVLAVVAVISVPLLFAPLVQSRDLYMYLFYGKMQAVHAANPYVVLPQSFGNDPWFGYVTWPRATSAYGPLWSLVSAGVVAVSRGQLIAAFFLEKGVALATGGAAVWGLATATREAPEETSPTPALAVAAFALNPLVVSTVALGGHADAAVAACFAWAVVTDRRRHPIATTLLLAAATLVKAYAAAALLVYLMVRWRRDRPSRALVSAGMAALTVGAYAPYWSGSETFRAFVSLSGATSGSLAGAVQRWISSALSAVGVDRPDHAASAAVRAIGCAVVLLILWRVARSPRTVPEPWRAAGLVLGAFFLVSPWYLPWYAVSLLPLVLVAGDPALTAGTLVFTGTSLWTLGGSSPGLLGPTAQAIGRYGVPVVAYRSGHRALR